MPTAALELRRAAGRAAAVPRDTGRATRATGATVLMADMFGRTGEEHLRWSQQQLRRSRSGGRSAPEPPHAM